MGQRKIISNCGLRNANLKARSQETEFSKKGIGQRVGGWRSGLAGLEVGGKGKIIANFEMRIANLGDRSQEPPVK